MTEILTAVLVLITAFYAWATYRILKANEKVVQVMQEQSEAMTRPYVTVSTTLEADNPIFYLSITNTGRTAARNLRLILDKPFHKFGEPSKDRDIGTFSAFNHPVDAFPPGASMIFSLAQGSVVFAKDADESMLPKRFTVTTEYEYGLDKKVREDHVIDLRPYLNADIPQEAMIRKLADMIKALEKIATNVKKP
jgi:hypothetical protein